MLHVQRHNMFFAHNNGKCMFHFVVKSESWDIIIMMILCNNWGKYSYYFCVVKSETLRELILSSKRLLFFPY